MDVTLANYIHLLKEFRTAEKKKRYSDMLNLGLESVSYIANISRLKPEHRDVAVFAVNYVLSCLAVLQEEREINNILQVLEQYSIERDVDDKTYSQAANELYALLETERGCTLEDIYEEVDASRGIIEELITRARQLKIIDQKEDRLFVVADKYDLKTILAS